MLISFPWRLYTFQQYHFLSSYDNLSLEITIVADGETLYIDFSSQDKDE